MASDEKNKLNIPFVGLLAVKNLLITKKDLQDGLSHCAGSKDMALALKDYFLSNELVSSRNMERLLRAAKAFEMRQKEFKFGAIAIRKGFINQSVLKLALEEQGSDIKNKKKIRMIGDILVEAGMLTPKQKDYIFKLQKRVKRQIKEIPEQQKDKTPSSESKIIDKVSGIKTSESSLQNLPEKESVLLEPEIIDGGIKLQISENFMAAFLSKTDSFDQNITLDEIKEALFDKGIIFGIVVDEMIEGFINSSGFKTKSFRVARGEKPVQGQDAKVEFFFNTDYLKAGGMTEDGTIDFKDRGEIPYVEEGTLLAEKIPLKEARNGRNIYGDEIQTIPGTDMALKVGKGAKLSEDGFKILAAVKGFPKYALSGHVFVHQEYITQGDVDYETGHITYDGNVLVKGRIKSGFKVKGNDIKAVEVDGAQLTAQGNIIVEGGINEGKIYSRGNVYAKFIHASEIICMGDVIVQKEIVDTDVECSGYCGVENGKFISSRITAKMGVKVKNIGTDMADPNIIKVGQDAFTQKELDQNKDKVNQLETMISQHRGKKEKLKQENLNLQKQITELAHIQDRSQLEEKQMNLKISSIQKQGADTQKIIELKEKIIQLKTSAKKAEENLDTCFDKSEKIEGILEKESVEIRALEKKREDILAEKSNLVKWARANPGQSIVIAHGAILPGTVIYGLHSEKRVNEIIRHAKIMEVLCTSEDGHSLNIYEMKVVNI